MSSGNTQNSVTDDIEKTQVEENTPTVAELNQDTPSSNSEVNSGEVDNAETTSSTDSAQVLDLKDTTEGDDDDKHLVKLYLLNEQSGDWVDAGIGYLRITDRDVRF